MNEGRLGGRSSEEQFFSNTIGYHDHVTRLPSYERVSVVDSSLATYLNRSPTYPGQANNSIDYYDKGMLIAFGLDAVLRKHSDTNLNQAFSAFFHKLVPVQKTVQGDLGYTTEQVFDHFDTVLPGLRGRLVREVCQPGGLDTLDLLRRLGFTVAIAPLSYMGIARRDVVITGLAERDGVDGIDGIDGANGADGTNGIDGIDGIDGANGTNGINGIIGANGANGANGADGADGANGADGADGVFPLDTFDRMQKRYGQGLAASTALGGMELRTPGAGDWSIGGGIGGIIQGGNNFEAVSLGARYGLTPTVSVYGKVSQSLQGSSTAWFVGMEAVSGGVGR